VHDLKVNIIGTSVPSLLLTRDIEDQRSN
jgi:hypothetical protein